jgi:hypothetical protein
MTTEIEPKNKILHIRRNEGQYNSPDQYGGLTLAYSWDKRDSFIKVATSMCSNQDKFVKSIGSGIAIQSLAFGNCVTIPYTKTMQKVLQPAEFLRDMFSKSYDYL